jgi:hypothetical protein
VVADDVVAHLQFLGELTILHTDKRLVTCHFFLAIEQELLASLYLHTWFAVYDFSESDARALQVNIDATFLARNFCSFANHLNQDLVLFVLDLGRVYAADVHPFLQELDYRRLYMRG